MIDRNLARGLFLIAIALAFGVTAVLHYPLGDFSRAGPGLYPAMVSSMLLLIGIATVVRSFFVAKERLDLSVRNIAIILAALCAFAVTTLLVGMLAGIVALVFIATIAGSSYSWKRNLKISAGLVVMAFVFSKLLGMNLPLY